MFPVRHLVSDYPAIIGLCSNTILISDFMLIEESDKLLKVWIKKNPRCLKFATSDQYQSITYRPYEDTIFELKTYFSTG